MWRLHKQTNQQTKQLSDEVVRATECASGPCFEIVCVALFYETSHAVDFSWERKYSKMRDWLMLLLLLHLKYYNSFADSSICSDKTQFRTRFRMSNVTPGAWGPFYYCVPLVCTPKLSGGFAVWWPCQSRSPGNRVFASNEAKEEWNDACVPQLGYKRDGFTENIWYKLRLLSQPSNTRTDYPLLKDLSLLFFGGFWVHTASASSTDGGAVIGKPLARRHSRNGLWNGWHMHTHVVK